MRQHGHPLNGTDIFNSDFIRYPFVVKLFSLSSSKSVIARGFDEMPCIVQSKDADIVSAADLEPIDTAIRSHKPGRLFGRAVDGTHQMKGHKTDRAGMRKDRDPLALMISQNFPQLGRRPF